MCGARVCRTVLFFLLLPGWSARVGGQVPHAAPLNPAFVSRLEAADRAGGDEKEDGRFGYRPGPVDFSYLRQPEEARSRLARKSFDASYDLRSLGRVTSVKNQNPYGTCWAFATMASMESCRLPGQSNDFSENNLLNLHGYNWGFGSGGNAAMSMAYLARWNGPLHEAMDAYPQIGGSTSLPPARHVHQVMLIPPRTNAADNNAIKQALTNYGGVYVNYYHSDAYYSGTYKSYFYSGTYTANHAVTIVGWDDDFPSNRFVAAAPGHGAFIVKNSWGTGWGDGGYYYVSYHDSKFGWRELFVFLNAEHTNTYKAVYQYDPLGWIAGFGTGSGNTYWGANIFTSSVPGWLGAVGFYALTPNTAYQLFIYTNVTAGSPRSGTLAVSNSGASVYAGYRTLPLNPPVRMSPGQRFSIVLRASTPGYNYPQAIEYSVAGYSTGATAAAGQSFYSSSGGSWTDLTTWQTTANFCIKGYVLSDRTLTVQSSRGGVHPGSMTSYYGAAMSQYVTNSPLTAGGTQYVCAGASLSGNVFIQASPTNVILTLTNQAALTWLWGTNFWLATSAGPHGGINVGSGWRPAGVATAITAFAEDYYHFTHWAGDVAGTNNPLQVGMSGAMSVTAHFAENVTTNTGTPEWWLASHGWTNGFAEAAGGDQDEDGLLTWQEFVAGTDPTNVSSSLIMEESRGASTGAFVIQWPAVSGRYYSLYYFTNFASSVPTEVFSQMRAERGGLMSYTSMPPADAACRLYRIKVNP